MHINRLNTPAGHLHPTRTWAGLTVLAITFIIFAFPRVDDPDFGWHLKSGQVYSETGHIPSHDIFSYTMRDYSWVNQTYAVDIFYYLLYRWGGQTTILLSLFFLALAVVTFLIVFPRTFPYTLKPDERLFAGLIALLISRGFFGVRSQVFDWLGFLLVILIWNSYKKTHLLRTLAWYIPLFFLWANIHAGFLIGFAILGFLFCFDIIDKLTAYIFNSSPNPAYADGRHEVFSPNPSYTRRGIKGLQWFFREKYRVAYAGSIILIACASTFINPYGVHLYQDIIRTLSDRTALETIAEWQPSVVSYAPILPFTIYVFSLILLLMIYKQEKIFSLRDGICVIIFLLFAFSSLRLIPFFILLSLPLFAYAFAHKRFFLPALMFFIIPGFLIGVTRNVPQTPPQSTVFHKDIFYNKVPTQAFAYLRAHPMKGNMFNDYDWGGAIIWSFPEYKTFIDGRMSYWRLNNRYIYGDYLAIKHVTQDWDKKIKDYDISWFIIKKSDSIAAVLETLSALWQKQYDDGFAVIFVRKQ